jgi:diaminohydroxyphosphoribosylaminopyrimidine deaminase / 5-amino-6-(5-phosphoribosylamino)uracil reductase
LGLLRRFLTIYHGTMTTAPKEHPCTDGYDGCGEGWADVPRMFRERDCTLPPPWQERFGPLRHGRVDSLVVVGQVGQSIDARIATANGDSKYINGVQGLAHLHRLRALVDAVLIGVGTAQMDDPQLTVRRVTGPSPARVIVDPNGRLSATAHVLAEDGSRRLVITRAGNACHLPPGVEIVALPETGGQIPPSAILAALAGRGFHRILVEGGANTVSRFLDARCLDRLHVVIAPIIIGAGPSSVSLPPIARVGDALKAPIRAHVLGEELLVDCDLTAQRVPIGVANRSM